jgi:hypothetical protein
VAHDPVPWHFAIVDVRNAAPSRWVPFLARETAFDSEVSIQFFRRAEAVTEVIPARWSDRPEPIDHQLATDAQGQPFIAAVFAPNLVPDSRRLDLPAGGRRQEVAVAVLRDGEAYGWGAESYAFPFWRNPDWRLSERAEYEVVLTIQWAGGTAAERLRLPYLSDEMGAFRLHPGPLDLAQP